MEIFKDIFLRIKSARLLKPNHLVYKDYLVSLAF